ncbi:hypothetical protein AB0O07_28735 [Streptomyces sp. NPDC093085]|uniref:hypothetical protein n=1 Tax=Streptomyces sp. NPDC093085 TaxID=3155068 RepID=UPI00342A5721
MSGDEPYAGHNGALLVLLILTGLVAVITLTIYGIRGLTRAGRTGGTLYAPAAALAWDATAGMYTWGLLRLLFHDDYAQAQACRDAVGARLSGYDATFVPLRFGCRTADGQVVEAIIPSYLNPVTAVLAVCALVLTGLVIAHHKKGIHT